jgi:hypothetical protein
MKTEKLKHKEKHEQTWKAKITNKIHTNHKKLTKYKK